MQQDEDLKQPQWPVCIVGLGDTSLVIPKILKMGPRPKFSKESEFPPKQPRRLIARNRKCSTTDGGGSLTFSHG